MIFNDLKCPLFYNVHITSNYPDASSQTPEDQHLPILLSTWVEYRDKLKKILNLAIDTQQHREATTAFDELPPILKKTFYFWVNIHSPDLKKENKNFDFLEILLSIKDPYLFERGENLIKQLIYSFEQKIEILKTQEATKILKQLESECNDPSATNQTLLTSLHQLPLSIQWTLHEIIYLQLPSQPFEFEHGKRFLEADVRLALLDLKKKDASSQNILSQIQTICSQRLQTLSQEKQKELKRQYQFLWFKPNFSLESLQELYTSLDPTIQSQIEKPYLSTPLNEIVLPHLPRHQLYKELGACPTIDGTKFSTYAPHAEHVDVVLTFEGRVNRKIPMIHSNGIWEVNLSGIGPGTTYFYEITSQRGAKLKKIDPFSLRNYKYPKHGFQSVVTSTDKWRWSDAEWMKNRSKKSKSRSPISIYEIHLNSWKKNEEGKLPYQQMSRELARYCKEIGCNYVEIFGWLEHSYEGSWGYQPLSSFGLNHRHFNTQIGTWWDSIQEVQELVDYLHSQEIGVIFDWIPGHFDIHSAGLSKYDGYPLFEREDHAKVWGAFRFDYTRSFVRDYLLSSAFCLMDLFHIDGIRLDSLDTILEGAPGRDEMIIKSFMQNLNSVIKTHFPGALMIAECWRTDGITTPGGFGFDYKWSSGSASLHDFMKLSFSDRIGNLYRATKAAVEDNQEQLIRHIDHDQTRQKDGSLYQQMPGYHYEKMANLRLWLSYHSALPGQKLMFMGTELAQTQDWETRMLQGVKKQPSLSAVQWEMQNHSDHRGMQQMVKKLNELYFSFLDLQQEAMQWIDTSDTKNNVVSFSRGERLICVCNFSEKTFPEYNVYFPQERSEYKKIHEMREFFNSDEEQYGGSGKTNPVVTMIKNEQNETRGFKVQLPFLSSLFFETLSS